MKEESRNKAEIKVRRILHARADKNKGWDHQFTKLTSNCVCWGWE